MVSPFAKPGKESSLYHKLVKQLFSVERREESAGRRNNGIGTNSGHERARSGLGGIARLSTRKATATILSTDTNRAERCYLRKTASASLRYFSH